MRKKNALLLGYQSDFFHLLRDTNFDQAQDYIYDEGIYFFTAGRIPKNEFDPKV